MDEPEIIWTELVNGCLEIIKRYRSGTMLASNPPKPMPDRIVKEVYGVKPRDPMALTCNHEVVLLRVIEGNHIPAHHVPERFVWPTEG